MKKVILTLMLAIVLASCAGAYKQAAYISEKSYLGMPLQEFKSLAGKKASLEAMESGYTVYRINDYDAWQGHIIDTKFYYFNSEGKLVKIDGGEFKQKKYQLEIIRN